MQIREALNWYQKKITGLYDQNESRSITELLFMHLFNFSKAKLLLNDNLNLPADQNQQLEIFLQRLLNNEPVQYILGETEFYGLKFFVNTNVLIPRPETEELVQWIIEDLKLLKNKPGMTGTKVKLLDIGTGSGCIPISIKKNIRGIDIHAMDVSADALIVAKQNAKLNNVEINFIEADILNLKPEFFNEKPGTLNVIISNPPYIRKSEMQKMHANVLQYEPHLALFVEDEDALLFYKRILEFAFQYLANDGKLYFEVNEAKGIEVMELLTKKGFKNSVLRKDLNGKDRMIAAIK